MKKVIWKRQKNGRLVVGDLECVVWPQSDDVLAWAGRHFLGHFDTVKAAKSAALKERAKLFYA